MTATLSAPPTMQQMLTNLITPEVDFSVTLEHIKTDPNSLPLDNNRATVRVDPNGTRTALAVVGRTYQVVDQREVIKAFAQVLTQAKQVASVEHSVYRLGARVYSRFLLDETVDIVLGDGKVKAARPFFTLTTSHDGSMKVGFLVGAIVDGQEFYTSNEVHGCEAKHLHGMKLAKTLAEINKLMSVFAQEVVPLWKKMMMTSVTLTQAQEVIAQAIKRNVLSERRSKTLALGAHTSLWDLYRDVVKSVSEPTKKGGEEGGIWRNAGANKFFIDELERMAS